MIKQFRLLIFSWIICIALWVLPKEAIKTLRWIRDIPIEE